MDFARLQRKRAFRRLLALVLVLGPGLVIFCGPGAHALSDRIVTDRHRGLAIDGFDPVAFFTDAKAVAGRAEFEYRHKGVIWRFRNEGNRAAFARDPDVYMPRFGGYDAVALARGVAVPGNPLVWQLSGDRLYLFFDPDARDRFTAHPAAVITAAEANWPDVMRQLAP